MSRHPGFPFEPKSTAFVRPGHFWAIPTRRGGWHCCGRILAISDLTATRSVVVGLLSWCEPHLPTADTIAGAPVLDYGVAHVKTVRETGGMLLGPRPLDADGLDQILNDRDWSVWPDGDTGPSLTKHTNTSDVTSPKIRRSRSSDQRPATSGGYRV